MGGEEAGGGFWNPGPLKPFYATEVVNECKKVKFL